MLGKCCGCFARQLNRFGWAFVVILSLAMVVFASFSLLLPWFEIDYFGGCDGHYMAVELPWGMCNIYVPGSAKARNCLGWDNDGGWREVDEQSGKSTHFARTYLFPYILIMNMVALTFAGIQFIISVMYYRWIMSYRVLLWPILGQYLVLFLTLSYFALLTGAQTLGLNSTVTDPATWQYTNTCEQHKAYPAVGYSLVNSGGTTCVYIVVTLVSFPNRLW